MTASATADALTGAVRRLALPTSAAREADVVDVVGKALTARKVAPDDQPLWLDTEAAAWEESGVASDPFRRVVRAALRAGDDTELGERLAKSYFTLHPRLARHPLLDHSHAVMVLSHALLAGRLARDEDFSAAMVAAVLQARDARTPLNWTLVDPILSALGYRRELTTQMMQDLLTRDAALEPEVFGDASFAECAEQLGRAARHVHFPHDLERELLALFPLSADGDPTWVQQGAHLAMLHFCCAQVEHWDHKISAIYEFAPRGQAANAVAKRYRGAGAYKASQNMFLNNAKSAGRLDRDWAWTKRPNESASAHAVANVLDGLDALARAPRRHLAEFLRVWLMRIVRVAGGTQLHLPQALDDQKARGLAEAISAGPTGTRGVLEQRLTDALGKAIHGETVVARGTGDSVNANNLSRAKLGDAEFEVGTRRITAYEPHGGDLRQLYVDAHDRSIGQVIPRRLAEWDQAGSTRGAWAVEVVLVAYDVSGVQLPATRLESAPGVSSTLEVKYRAVTFEDLLAATGSTALADPVNRYVMRPLDAPYVPDAVKQAVLARVP